MSPAWPSNGVPERMQCVHMPPGPALPLERNGELRHVCVCSLGLLVRKVHKDQAERILDFLCTKLLTGKKDQDRENASVALKSVISEITGQEVPGLVIKQVVPKLLQGMQAQADVATSCMDIMNNVVGRFGHLLTNEHGPLKTTLLQDLATSKAGIRKRALACLGAALILGPCMPATICTDFSYVGPLKIV